MVYMFYTAVSSWEAFCNKLYSHYVGVCPHFRVNSDVALHLISNCKYINLDLRCALVISAQASGPIPSHRSKS